MAPQNREKEETELKQLPNNTIPICTPPQTIPVPPPLARSSNASDPAARRTEEESRTSPGNSPEKVDLPAAAENRKRPREVTRCSGSGCRKRVGLMGFRCRCGDVFCSEHRYSDRHECGYDYKAAGREAIQRENPVVKAVKLVKV